MSQRECHQCNAFPQKCLHCCPSKQTKTIVTNVLRSMHGGLEEANQCCHHHSNHHCARQQSSPQRVMKDVPRLSCDIKWMSNGCQSQFFLITPSREKENQAVRHSQNIDDQCIDFPQIASCAVVSQRTPKSNIEQLSKTPISAKCWSKHVWMRAGTKQKAVICSAGTMCQLVTIFCRAVTNTHSLNHQMCSNESWVCNLCDAIQSFF